MERDENFWALRDCFLTPIPQLEQAAQKLDHAAFALLSGDFDAAKQLIKSCEMPELDRYRAEIVEGTKPHVHRVRSVANAPPKRRGADSRMPGKKVALSIFRRDGWRCRFCGIKIVSLDAIKILDSIFPQEVRWKAKPYANRNVAFNVLASSLDHIVPHSRGGNNDPHNLVGACGSCQFGRMQYTLEEVGFTDPRDRTPVKDNWDGLERLVEMQASFIL
jgi:hypothetical protein